MENLTDQELIEAVVIEVMGWHKEKPHGLIQVWCNKSGEAMFPYDNENTYKFNPLTNANHWMMVVERMRELGYWVGLYLTLDNRIMAKFIGKNRSIKESKTLGYAVCLAALEAVRNSK